MSQENNKNISLGILIPCFNGEKYLAKLINRLLKLNASLNYKLYILNDGSEDNTQQIINKYQQKYPEKIIGFSNQKNLGIFMARFQLLDYASTDFIIFLDTDDELDHLVMDKLNQYKNFDFIKLKRILVFSKESKILEASVYKKTKIKSDLLKLTQYFYITGCCLSKKVYKKIVAVLSVYKNSLLGINCFEDIIIYYLAVNFSTNFAIINCFYYYNRVSDGVTRTSESVLFSYLLKVYEIFSLVKSFLKNNNEVYESDANPLFYILFLLRNFANTKDEIKKINLLFKKNFPSIKCMNNFKNKVKYIICTNDFLFKIFSIIKH